jgi:hypothetical protein
MDVSEIRVINANAPLRLVRQPHFKALLDLNRGS